MAVPRDFGFGPDEQLLRDEVRKFLDRHAGPGQVHALVAADHAAVYERGELPGYDVAVWRDALALGWGGLAVPEPAGGLGVAAVGIAAVMEEVGRHAFPSPLPAMLGCAFVLRAAATEAAHTWLARLSEGRGMTLAFTGAHGSWEPREGDVRARRDGDGLVLEGSAHYVQDLGKVDVLLVRAVAEEGHALCVVDKTSSGVHVQADHIVDLTRDQGRVRFDGVRVPESQVVAPLGTGLAALEAALPALLVLTAADLVGSSEWLLQSTVEYARVRQQFGRPLGFFQAVKHPLVDAMIEIDRARSHVYRAAAALDHEPALALTAARMAKAQASDASAFTGARAVQLHGGIGFTWESHVHLFLKRGLHGEALYGDGVYQRAKLADVLLGPLEG